MRDATNSWSGYIYQAIVGLIVALENISVLVENQVDINGNLIFEDIEDFSIYILDSDGREISSQTHQVKFYKTLKKSEYYDAIRTLLFGRGTKTGFQYYLNIEKEVDFSKVNILETKDPIDVSNIVYKYLNGKSYIEGAHLFQYLNEVIKKIYGLKSIGFTNDKIDIVSARLISFVDQVIIRTKVERETNKTFTRSINLNELIDILENTTDQISQEIIVQKLKNKISEAYYRFIHSVETKTEKLDDVFIKIISLENIQFVDFVRKIELHKDLASNSDLFRAISSPEDLQEVLYELLYSALPDFDVDNAVIWKKSCAYRPTTMRLGLGRSVEANLSETYIPQIQKNMNLFELENYFETKKLIISGNSVEDIWSFNISSTDEIKKEFKITEPELKCLINITEAIEELNKDE